MTIKTIDDLNRESIEGMQYSSYPWASREGWIPQSFGKDFKIDWTYAEAAARDALTANSLALGVTQ